MKIKTVQYLATLNLGNYQNERIGFVAKLDEGESPETVVEQLRQKVKDCALPNTDTLYSQIRERKEALDILEIKLSKARQQWDATAEFLRKQGIKPDAVDLPQFTQLLPQVQDEISEVTEGEIDDDSEDEDDEDDGF
jgi:hypothetical protein